MEVRENKNIVKAGIDKELETLNIILSSKIGRTTLTLEEYIQTRLAQGATLEIIKSDLLTDLEEGGRIFGEFKNALQPTFAGSVNRFRDVGVFGELGTKIKYRWVAVLVNTCPDCLDRHKESLKSPKLWVEWEEEGLPRSGVTVCGQECKCILLPVKITEPIIRGG